MTKEQTEVRVAVEKQPIDWKRLVFMFTGIILFIVVYYCPPWPDAVDPLGKHFVLTKEGKGALAVFLLAGTWWVFEVVPIGVTSLAIGMLQALFLIRPAKVAFKDFMDPSVLFIFGSMVIGMVFTKTGLTKRLAYKMLTIVGERTSMIYLGCFVVTAALTHIMAHTAVAATIYPLLLAIYALYSEEETPTKFGKGLFIGMAYVAGAGSIITLLGAARGAVALGFFKDIIGQGHQLLRADLLHVPHRLADDLPALGLLHDLLQAGKGEDPRPAGKGQADCTPSWAASPARRLLAAVIVGVTILVMSLRSFVPALKAAGQDRHHALLDHPLLPAQDPQHRGPGRDPLEHHPALRRRHEHRLLPVGDRRGQVAGRQLAGHVPEGPLVRLRPGHRLLRHGHDQLHHERGRHRHLPAGGPGHRPLPGGGAARSSSSPPWSPPACRSCCWSARRPTPSPTTPSSSPPASSSSTAFRPASC